MHIKIVLIGKIKEKAYNGKIQKYLEDNFDLDGLEMITHSSSEYDFIVSVE